MELEYQCLREEIMLLMQKRDEYTRFAYTAIAAIWAVAMGIENAYIVLLGMIILIPISIRVTDVLYSSGHISAYMSVFLESNIEAKWETNNYEYHKRFKRNNKNIFRYIFGRMDFVILQCMNTFIFWIYRNERIFSNVRFDVALLIGQIAVIVFAIYLCHYSAMSDFNREKDIHRWKMLKDEKANIYSDVR